MFAAADHDRNCNFSDGKKWENIFKKTSGRLRKRQVDQRKT